jgi:hypothetical protein
MTIKMYPASAIELKNSSWLLYGRSGSGKTTLIGTFPPRILVVNFVCEGGVRTLRGHPGVDVVDVETLTDMNEAFDYLIKNYAKYRTIAIDSLTSLVDIMYRHTRAKRPVERMDWLEWRSKVYEMAERLRKLPVETVFTATQAANTDEATGSKFGGPNLFGSLEAGLPAKMDLSVLMECETDARGIPKYTAHLSGKGTMIGRVRGTLPVGSIESPTYAAIMDKIKVPLFKGNAPEAIPQPPPAPEPAKPELATEAAAKDGV